jgi:hypothetical protein
MNCVECRDNFVACQEGLLEREEELQCRAHLEACAKCRAEFGEMAKLQTRLIARGQAAGQVHIVGSVMRQIRGEEFNTEKETIMSKLLKHRWGFGFGAAAGTAAILAFILVSMPKVQAQAVAIMSKGAQAAAKLSSIHLRGQLRAPPQDNFSAITPDQDFVNIELWKQFTPDLMWRVEKPGRVAVMDGQSTTLFIKPDYGFKLAKPTSSAFDTQWLHEMANLSQTLESEVAAIKAHGWPVTLTQVQGVDGKEKSVISVEAASGLATSDYLNNKFFSTANTRRDYEFDDASELLDSVNIYLHTTTGDKLIFQLTEIDYNQPIDAGVFQLQLPADVSLAGDMPVLPDNATYAAMTSEQAAQAVFAACSQENWTEAAKFFNPLTGSMKEMLGGLKVVSIGTHFTSAGSLISGAEFVPYEITLKNGQVRKHNLALKRDTNTQRWYVDGGI